MLACGFSVGKEASAFKRNIDAVSGVRQIRRIALCGHMNTLATHNDIIAVGLNRARKRTVDAITLEQHCV